MYPLPLCNLRVSRKTPSRLRSHLGPTLLGLSLTLAVVAAGCTGAEDNAGPDGSSGVGGTSTTGGQGGGGEPEFSCHPGEYVTELEGLPGALTCEECEAGTFSAIDTARACSAWTECWPGDDEAEPPTSYSDRVCLAGEWMREVESEMPSGEFDIPDASGYAVSADAKGNVYFAGIIDVFSEDETAWRRGSFLVKYDSAGDEVWKAEFHEPTNTSDVTIDVADDGSILIAGTRDGDGEAPEQHFLRKCDGMGDEVWVHPLDDLRVSGISVDPSGNALVIGGSESGSLVRKYDGAGELLWTRTVEGGLRALGTDAEGNVAVTGNTRKALPDQVMTGDLDTFVRMYTPEGGELWTRQFGVPAENTVVAALSVDTHGNVIVGGDVTGDFPGLDGPNFLRKFGPSGEAQWTRQFGETEESILNAVSSDGSNNVLVLGAYGAPFIRKFSSLGSPVWHKRLDELTSDDQLVSVSSDGHGNVIVGGMTSNRTAVVARLRP